MDSIYPLGIGVISPLAFTAESIEKMTYKGYSKFVQETSLFQPQFALTPFQKLRWADHH
jgi:hypothetical protein